MTEQPLSGAQFQRHVGTNPEQWAGAFLAAYASAEGLHTDAARLAFVTGWFRDAQDAAVAEAVRAETAAIGRLVPRQE